MSAVIRLGVLRLCDAAPVVLADHLDMFGAAGLEVAVSVEPSWANIADKLSYGLLEGAVMLPPLALACAAGLRGRATSLVVPMGLSAAGNAVTLAARHAAAFAAGGMPALAPAKLRLAVVHGFSTHDLLLRYWLAAQGLDPARDVEIAVVPPAEMVGSLAAGAIDGFCAGAPWGEVAVHAGLGVIAVRSDEIWRRHPEKCLALTASFAAQPEAVTLMRVLLAAGAQCADPAARGHLAAMLARPHYLDLPVDLIARALDPAAGGPVFGAQAPRRRHALWFAGQMQRWGEGQGGVLDAAAAMYRPDLFEAAGGTIAPDEPDQLYVKAT
jgi:NitT/TauT family transport system ATP-binding protein/nitrate/nitrite transport system substrate-binding protein